MKEVANTFSSHTSVLLLLLQIFSGPRCRFPIQLELLEPAELSSKL